MKYLRKMRGSTRGSAPRVRNSEVVWPLVGRRRKRGVRWCSRGAQMAFPDMPNNLREITERFFQRRFVCRISIRMSLVNWICLPTM